MNKVSYTQISDVAICLEQQQRACFIITNKTGFKPDSSTLYTRAEYPQTITGAFVTHIDVFSHGLKSPNDR